MIYDNQEAEIHLVNGRSSPINSQKEVRQGCPLSPLIFNILTEVLVQVVWQADGVKGIMYQGKAHKILLYADDIVFSQRDLKNLIQTLKF